jgi:hemolysin D
VNTSQPQSQQTTKTTTPPQNVRSLAAGDFIFEEGEIGDLAFVVVSGTVEICKQNAGELVVLMEIEAGTLFGELALIDKSPRAASARAKTDAVVREVDEKALMAHIKRAPDVAINMMHRLASYVRTTNRTISSSAFDSASNSGEEGGAISAPRSGFAEEHHTKWDTDVDHIINEYQSPEIALQKRRVPPVITFSLLVVVAFIGSFIAWASLSIIDTTISARGRLTTTVPTISVQATDNSVVKNLHVAIGSRVKKGEVLVTLDATYAEADLSRERNEFEQLEIRIQRLHAEMNKERPSSVDKIDNPIEQKIFLSRHKEYASRISSFDLDIKSQIQKLQTALGDIDLAAEQLHIKLQLEEARRKLFEKEIGSHLNLLQAQDNRIATERSYRGLKSSTNNLKSEVEALRAKKQAFVSEWVSKIGVELSQAINERDSKKEELVKLRRRLENILIVAPADGVIIDIQDLFAGAIVNEGTTVMSLVPSDVPLTVEIDVDPRDIGNLLPGAHASIKLDAVPYQKHGELIGEIGFISDDTVDQSLTGEKGTFYRARADILSDELRDLPPNFRLVPGMLLTTDIRAGRRRLITYFIYPVIRTIETSFAEPGK